VKQKMKKKEIKEKSKKEELLHEQRLAACEEANKRYEKANDERTSNVTEYLNAKYEWLVAACVVGRSMLPRSPIPS
jgi:hypothetical protein